jgi:hypothetical protein
MGLHRPSFPTPPAFQQLLLDYCKSTRRVRAGVDGREHQFCIGEAFQDLPQEGSLGCLRDIIFCTAAITTELSQLAGPFQNDPAFHHLVRIAGFNHHRLLDLAFDDTRDDSKWCDADGTMFTCLCLASLIFHDIVIYPLVETSNIKPRLASRLRSSLTRYTLLTPNSISDMSTTWDASGAILWAIVLGCIASTYSSDRAYFCIHLQQYADKFGLRTFPELKGLLEGHLWFGNMNEPALRAWLEGAEQRIKLTLMELQSPL